MRLIAIVPALAFLFLAGPAAARSAAADYLIGQQIEAACEGPGSFGPDGIIERDLTGDGRSDLILDHGAIDCDGKGRSLECGIRACSVYFYVREGQLLKLKKEILSIGVTVTGRDRPAIHLMGHNFEKTTWHWNGRDFE